MCKFGDNKCPVHKGSKSFINSDEEIKKTKLLQHVEIHTGGLKIIVSEAFSLISLNSPLTIRVKAEFS